METQRLLLYLAFGFLSLIIYQTWLQDYHAPVPVTQTSIDVPGATAVGGSPAVSSSSSNAADLPDAVAGSVVTQSANENSVQYPTVSVSTDIMDIAISTRGATIARVDLLDYPVSIEDQDTPFQLVSDDPLHYLVVESGLQGRANESAPTHRELMTPEAESYTLVDGQDSIAVPFIWKSDSGITVTKTLTFYRSKYEVDVAYDISNGSGADWTVNQYRQLKRKPDTKDEKQQFMNTYIGAVVSNEEDRYTKISFGDMEDEDLNVSVTDGWVAMIQHYFATAWIPQAGEQNTAYSRYLAQENRYMIGMVSASQVIPAGAQGSFSTKAYIGPKIQDDLAAAAPHLELTVDFGWLTIIAQPLFWLLKTIHGFVGNWGWAIVFTTFVIKAVFYKLSEASYRSMARMKLLQPKLASLKERHGDDRAKMGQATMELYKKEKVNPLGGCLPMIIQMPVFIALYWTLMESVELRQAPFMLWIQDLSIKDPFFILPIIMAATMYFQQKLNPAPVDPIQAKVFQFLPLIFGIFFAFFPAGLVLYWVVNNSLSIAQQYYITRHVLADSTKASKKPNLKKS
ncbi:MAG: YidC/Oxa1 family membrane protein insertase [bacterium]|jgi:YidC/Oxa1 family membrane protein insertase